MLELQSKGCTASARDGGQAATACRCITLVQAVRNMQLLRGLQSHPAQQLEDHRKISTLALPMHAACAAADTTAAAIPSAAELLQLISGFELLQALLRCMQLLRSPARE